MSIAVIKDVADGGGTRDNEFENLKDLRRRRSGRMQKQSVR